MKVSYKFLFTLGVIILVSIWLIQGRFLSDDTWSSWQLPLSGQVILIDPGHGGVDGGAVAKDGTLEKDIALNISFKLRDYLQEAGALVLMTREGDYDLAAEHVKGYRNRKLEDLKNRRQMINETGSDMFITLHLNALESTVVSGAQTFYSPGVPENKNVAKLVQEELKEHLENSSKQAKPTNNVYLLEQADIPGLLIEVGFLSNPSDARNLKDEKYQEKVAAAIYEGMARHFSGEQSP